MLLYNTNTLLKEVTVYFYYTAVLSVIYHGGVFITENLIPVVLNTEVQKLLYNYLALTLKTVFNLRACFIESEQSYSYSTHAHTVLKYLLRKVMYKCSAYVLLNK